MREEKLPVSYSGFKTEALKISSDLGLTNFKASNGYLQKFFFRNRITKRVATHYIQKITNEVIENIKKFVIDIISLRFDFLKQKLEQKITRDLSNIIVYLNNLNVLYLFI